MGVNSLPKTVTRQRRDLNPGLLRLSPARYNHSATEPPYAGYLVENRNYVHRQRAFGMAKTRAIGESAVSGGRIPTSAHAQRRPRAKKRTKSADAKQKKHGRQTKSLFEPPSAIITQAGGSVRRWTGCGARIVVRRFAETNATRYKVGMIYATGCTCTYRSGG